MNPILKVYIGTDATEAGILQGEILIKEWNTKGVAIRIPFEGVYKKNKD